MKRFPIERKIEEFSRIFTENGHSLYIVGGSVRDHLLHIPVSDWDFTTDATPRRMMALFPRVLPTGIAHGTVTIRFKGESYEVTTFRSDGEYKDNRHPESVKFITDLAGDLERRDFTINALAVNTRTGEIIDLHHGREDLKRKTIRAIGDPEKRFEEDALRILRALRFASKLNFDIEEHTFEAMTKLKENLRSVSKERIHDELFKLIDSRHPAKGLNLMEKSGVMEILLPDLDEGKSVMQNGMHNDTVLAHNINACRIAAEHNFPLAVRAAALFHDIGKTRTVEYCEDHNRYYGHDAAGKKITERILRNLKASNEEIQTISHLVDCHMFHYTSDWSDAAVRRFINRVGLEYMDDLFRLRICDMQATLGECSTENIDELNKRIQKVIADRDALSTKDLKINGKDLIKLGIRPGPHMGKILSHLLEEVLDDPGLNNPGWLEKEAKRYFDLLSSH